MLNPELNSNKAFKENEINMENYFRGATMMPVRKVLQKGNTRVISLLIFDENRKIMIFKVLSSIVYCIMEKFVCVNYLSCPKKKLHVTCKGQLFENITYNAVSGIGIPELLMNIDL